MKNNKTLSIILLPFICVGCAQSNDAKTILIAHRGGSWKTTVENTKEAFLMAIDKGFRAIETDVQITKDNVFYCFHDSVLKNFNSEFPLSISKYYDSEIKDIEIKQKKGDDYVIGKLCLFSDYLDICKEHDITPVIELKSTHGIIESDENGQHNYDNIAPLISMIKQRDLLDKAIIISFMRGPLGYIKENYKDVDLQLLSNESPQLHIDWALDLGIGLDMHHSYITQEIVDKVHAKNLKINMWTYNDENNVQDYIDMGMDYITSDVKLF